MSTPIEKPEDILDAVDEALRYVPGKYLIEYRRLYHAFKGGLKVVREGGKFIISKKEEANG